MGARLPKMCEEKEMRTGASRTLDHKICHRKETHSISAGLMKVHLFHQVFLTKITTTPILRRFVKCLTVRATVLLTMVAVLDKGWFSNRIYDLHSKTTVIRFVERGAIFHEKYFERIAPQTFVTILLFQRNVACWQR